MSNLNKAEQRYPHIATLSNRARRLLEGGTDWDRYGSTHKALTAILGGMKRAGWTQEQAAELLRDQQFGASRRLNAKFGGGLTSTVGSKWRAVERRHLRHGLDCNEWVSTLMTKWPHGGKFGGTMRVAIGLALLAEEAGALRFTASVRRISEVAGVGYSSAYSTDTKSVRAALKRLSAWGIVSWIDDDQVTSSKEMLDASRRYMLAPPDRLSELLQAMGTNDPTKGTSYLERISGGLRTPAGNGQLDDQLLHVVFEEAALGMSACQVLFLLGSSSLSSSEIQSSLGFSRKGTYNVLRRLAEARLVGQCDDSRWLATRRNLDDVAEEMGVSMRAQWRCNVNALQRTQRRDALRIGRLAYRSRHITSDVGRVIDVATGEIVRRPFPDLRMVDILAFEQAGCYTNCGPQQSTWDELSVSSPSGVESVERPVHRVERQQRIVRHGAQRRHALCPA